MSFLYPDIIAPGVNLPIVTPQSPEGIERKKWDTPKRLGGYGPNGHEEYPKTLYKAGRPTKGNVEITESRTVHSESEELVAVGQGWARTQEAAIQLVHDTHVEHAKLAAERHYAERSMSEAAQREAAEADEGTVQHVPVIPEKPKRKYTRRVQS